MDQITHNVRLQSWRNIVSQCEARPEGQSAKQWLAQNSIPENQYYYWLRQVRQDAYLQIKTDQLPAAVSENKPDAAFAEIQLPEAPEPMNSIDGFHPDAVISTGSITAALSNTVSDSLLARILEAVSHEH